MMYWSGDDITLHDAVDDIVRTIQNVKITIKNEVKQTDSSNSQPKN